MGIPSLSKKASIWILILVFILTQIGNYLIFLPTPVLAAESVLAAEEKNTTVRDTNLVVIFVDQKIYPQINSDISRYAKEYIQGGSSSYNAISNAKAIILPINTDELKAPQIRNIIQNMYFDGVKDSPSKLKGIVLVGNIPLPVVNDNGYIFPTVYPYVDMENPKFIWDDRSRYFVPNDQNDGQPEIFHGLIQFSKVNEYHNFFSKLKEYSKNPIDYIGKRIWYEDSIANKKYYLKEVQLPYIANWLFAEDISYHRYTTLLLKTIQEINNGNIIKLLEKVKHIELPKPDLGDTAEGTPTQAIALALKKGLLQPYSSLWGKQYLAKIRENLRFSNRWSKNTNNPEGGMKSSPIWDSHLQKTVLKDEALTSYNSNIKTFFFALDEYLQNTIDQKVQEQKYYMNIPLPLQYLKFRKKYVFTPSNGVFTVWDKYNAYDNYFFGRRADLVEKMDETSIYRGTYRNLDSLSGITLDAIQSSSNPSKDIVELDLSKKSVGGSYDIFSQQVETSRKYNMINAKKEYENYEEHKIAGKEYREMKCDGLNLFGYCFGFFRWTAEHAKCNPKDRDNQQECETVTDFARRNRGSGSPLSSINNHKKQGENYEEPKPGTIKYDNARLPVFDIAGGKRVLKPIPKANSFESLKEFTNLIIERFSGIGRYKFAKYGMSKIIPALIGMAYNTQIGYKAIFPNMLPNGKKGSDGYRIVDSMKFSKVNYFDIYKKTQAKKEGNIIKLYHGNENDGEIWTFKTLDSRVYNISPNIKQINGQPYHGVNGTVFGAIHRLQQDIFSYPIIKIKELNASFEKITGKIKEIYIILNKVNNFVLGIQTGANLGINEKRLEEWSTATKEDIFKDLESTLKDINKNIVTLVSLLKETNISEIRSAFEKVLENFILANQTPEITKQQLKTIEEDFKNMNNQLEFYGKEVNTIHIAVQNIYNNLLQEQKIVSPYLDCTNNNILCNILGKINSNIIQYAGSINTSIKNIYSKYNDENIGWKKLNFIISEQKKKIQNIKNLIFQQIKSKVKIVDTLSEAKQRILVTTQDRPVDSPRYMTFQGLGGDVVKLIYPTLYKVEVFKKNGENMILKTPNEIKDSIKTYLVQVVKQYNKYLSEQKDKRDAFYKANSEAFNTLEKLNILASPKDRDPKLFPENYLIKKLEKRIEETHPGPTKLKPLDIVAEMLYYQNLPWKKTIDSHNIQQDIFFKKSTFDVNQRIKYILNNYLKADNLLGKIVLPDYKKDGYEVAYFNSDGDDYIDSQDDIDNDSIGSNTLNFKDIKKLLNQFNEKQQELSIQYNESLYDQSEFEGQLIDKCSTSKKGELLLDISTMSSPWFSALACWFKELKEKPFNVQITWDNAQGDIVDVLSSSHFNDTKNDIFTQGKNNREKIQRKRNALKTDTENREEIEQLTSAQAKGLQDMYAYTNFSLENNSITTDELETQLTIESTKQFLGYEIRLSTVGENNLILQLPNANPKKITDINNQNGFSNKLIIKGDPKETKTIKINLDPKKITAGYNVLIYELCIQNTDYCLKKTQKLNIVPGKIKKIGFVSPKNLEILPGAQQRINIFAEDKYGNNVGKLVQEKYKIKASIGTIGQEKPINSQILINDFSSPVIYYKSPNVNKKTEVKITIQDIQTEKILAIKNITIIPGKLDLTMNGVKWNTNTTPPPISFQLEDIAYYTYKDSDGIQQIDKNKVPSLAIQITDLKNTVVALNQNILLKSKNSILFPANIIQKEANISTIQGKKKKSQSIFTKNRSFEIKDGKLMVYFLPSLQAGREVIQINIPGVLNREFTVDVYPGNPAVIHLSLDKNNVQVGEEVSAQATMQDTWGNKLNILPEFKWQLFGFDLISSKKENGQLSTVFKAKPDISGDGIIALKLANNKGGKLYKPGLKKVKIMQSYIPEDSLNVMYLNIFGTDWGNLWGYFSRNNKWVSHVMASSPKLLATTTMGIDPQKVKKTIMVLGTDGQVQTQVPIKLSLQRGKLVYMLENIGSLSYINNLSVKQILSSQEIKDIAGIYYLANPFDSIITVNEIVNSKLIVNNQEIIDFKNGMVGEGIDMVLSRSTDQYTWFDVRKEGRNIGKIAIITPDINNWKFLTLDAKYHKDKIWLHGSTEGEEGYAIFDSESRYQEQKIYDSIQDSKDPQKGIGFRSNFRNISNFGIGMSVGESTLPYASEFLLNFGDPFLRKVNKNTLLPGGSFEDKKYDGGMGRLIASYPNKKITKTEIADIDGDGQDDIVVLFSDGSIRMIKKYQGIYNYKDIGDLILISEGAKDFFVGDLDGNSFPDILIQTQSNKMFAYPNDKGQIAADGYPVCLNVNVSNGISQTPENLDVGQLFVQDMDNDGELDIIVYDRLGYIKIFYGGKGSFLSKEKYTCDKNRYERQKSTTLTMKKYGVTIQTDKNIVDHSLIRWKGLGTEVDTDLEFSSKDLGLESPSNLMAGMSTLTNNPNSINVSALQKQLQKGTKMDTNKAIKLFKNEYRKILENPLGFQPKYEDSKDIGYITIQNLKNKDPVKVYKNYQTSAGNLIPGNKVQVQVTISAQEDTILTFADRIHGPWKINIDTDHKIAGWNIDMMNTATNIDTLQIEYDITNSTYIIDNIVLKKGESIKINYILEYQGKAPPMKLILRDVNGLGYRNIDPFLSKYKPDGLIDILVEPKDACVNQQTIFFNNQQNRNRAYDEKTIDIDNYIREKQQKEKKQIEKLQEEQQKQFVKKTIKGLDDLPGVGKFEERNDISIFSDQVSTRTFLEEQGLDLTNIANLGLDVIGKWVNDNVTNKLTEYTDNLCNPINQGVPAPFNQAFLGPGKYHVFGCFDIPPLTRTIGKGIPTIAFPGNWPTPLGYLPMINFFGFPVKGPLDTYFGGPSIGTNSSYIRVYLMPTLTAQVVTALCVGYSSTAARIPSPISDLGGNCFVVPIKLNQGSNPKSNLHHIGEGDNKGTSYENGIDSNKSKNNINSRNNDNAGQDPFMKDIGVCMTQAPDLGPDASASPFVLVQGEKSYPILGNNSYLGGAINFDVQPVSDKDIGVDKEGFNFEGIEIFGGLSQQNKILGGNPGGFIKKLIKDWLGKQIRYIMNNFTKMRIDLILPDFSSLLNQIDDLDINDLKSLHKTSPGKCKDLKGERNTAKNICVVSQQQQCKNSKGIWDGKICKPSNKNKISRALKSIHLTRDTTKLLENSEVLNISDKLENFFHSVPLVNVTSEVIPVNIPMITAEQIDAYTDSAQAWILRQKDILKEWNVFIQYFIKECKDNKSQGVCNKSQKVMQDIVVFKSNIESQINRVRKNLATLQTYKTFPLKLYKMINVQERYLSELSSLINVFVGSIGIWMKTTAIRLASYVDALTTIISTLETYQLLIDFPLEWKQKCGTCSQDTYDQYSCKLSFMCNINLPVLPIPPFKIPNIRVDLSQFNFGLNIKLPKFAFNVQPIPLPELPDIPTPPQLININFNINFNLNIPIIPVPPEIPELPSVIPTIKVNLIQLPPAPRIPEIPDKITAILDLAKTIGKVMCVVKNLPFVGENSLKAKAEQITQRTYELPLWDLIDQTPSFVKNSIQFIQDTANTELTDAPLRGFDIEVASFVDLQYDFTNIFEIIKAIVNKINTTSQNLENTLNEGVSKINREIVESTQEYIDEGNKRVGDKIKEGSDATKKRIEDQSNKIKKDTKKVFSYESLTDEETAMKMYREKLILSQQQYSEKSVAEVKSNLREGLQRILQESNNSITTNHAKKLLTSIQETIHVDSTDITPVVNAAKEFFSQEQRDLKKISSVIKNDYKRFYKDIANMQTVANTENISFSGPLFTLNGESNISTFHQDDEQLMMTPPEQGIYVDLPSGKSFNTVASAGYATQIAKRYFIRDINKDGKEDIVLRDDTAIFIKYHADTIEEKPVYIREYIYPIKSEKQLRDITDRYVGLGDIELKLASKNYEVNNVLTEGQSIEDISMQWTNPLSDNQLDGYLIRLNNTITTFPDKTQLGEQDAFSNQQYMLLLPESRSYTGTDILLYNKNINIAEALTSSIIGIDYYDSIENLVSIDLPIYEKKWKYMQVAGLKLSKTTYEIVTPFSNQIVGGPEASSDNIGPDITAELYRPSTKQIISDNTLLVGYVGTNYTFRLNITDQTALKHIYVTDKDGKEILNMPLEGKNQSVIVEKLYFTKEIKKEYKILAEDIRGNRTNITLPVQILTPKIEINKIIKQGSGQQLAPVNIVAKMNQDIDEGIVNFMRGRKNREPLKGTIIDYIVKPLQTIIVGGKYIFSDRIALFANGGEKIGMIDPHTGRVNLVDTKNYEIQTKLDKKGPLLNIRNKKTKTVEYTVRLPGEKLIAINEGVLQKVVLDNESFGIYRGGWALVKNNTIYMYISPTGEISSLKNLDARYEYDPITKYVTYYFSDISKHIDQGSITVKVRDFLDDLR